MSQGHMARCGSERSNCFIAQSVLASPASIPATTDAIIHAAEGASAEEFRQLAWKRLEGTAVRFVRISAEEAEVHSDDEISRVGRAMERPGQVGLARGKDGVYYVLRARRVQLEAALPWNEEQELIVKNDILRARRESILRSLERDLRHRVRVEVIDAVLDSIQIPSQEEWLADRQSAR